MDIKIKQINNKDIHHFLELIKVFEHVFEWDNFSFPNQAHLQKILDNESIIVFIALINNRVVGGLTAHILDRYDCEKPSAYIYDLAVLKELQRKGIGRRLITTLYEYCKRNGFVEVFVQAETDDTQAINFYRTTAVNSELPATHFTYSFSAGVKSTFK